MNWWRRTAIDFALVVAVLALAAVGLVGLAASLDPRVEVAAVVGLALAAVGSAVVRVITRPDHVRALHSHSILEIANRSLAFLRQGLTEETAEEVCRLALKESEAAAVAITDRERVLGFAGLGEDHHTPGGPIITRGTHEALEANEHRILESREEIGCPERKCLLRAAIVVPLEMRGSPVGTLKFYYTTPRLINETQVAMVQGLARLLSTQLELSELDRQTALACSMELKALQSQINPHFLFNTINAIASLIRTDPPEARRLLRDFATFYRRTLENNQDLIPLSRELEYTRAYLGFEMARFGERLLVDEDVGEGVGDFMVPAFVLQPIVENAVQHAFRPVGALTIRIRIRREDGVLRLSVADDGRGIRDDDLPRVMEQGFGRGLGIALKNVDDRLKGHFGLGSGLTIESTEGVGTTVTLKMVLQAAEGRV